MRKEYVILVKIRWIAGTLNNFLAGGLKVRFSLRIRMAQSILKKFHHELFVFKPITVFESMDTVIQPLASVLMLIYVLISQT
jgi:hypothetical protein